MWTYPISLKRDSNGSWLATAPDFPEVTTFGASPAQAQDRTRDAIEEAIAARMADREDIPLPSKHGRYRTTIPTQTVLKVQLYRAMRGQNINKADLARRLRVHRPQIDRLLNVKHTTNLDRIDEAFAAIGYRVDVTVKRSAAG